MQGKFGVLWGGVLALMLISGTSHADVPERRKDQFGRDFGYYIYPIAGEVPGLGKASGGGASVLNMGGGDTDLTVYSVSGGFKANGVALTDFHVLKERLILDAGYNDYRVAPVTYNRGIASDPLDVIQPQVEGSYLIGQMTLTFAERRFELFLRELKGESRLTGVLDKNGQSFAGVDTSWQDVTSVTWGGSLDLTDDRLDPREGVRLEFARRQPSSSGNADTSRFYVDDYNLTGYLPVRRWDTLAFNLFYSGAHVTSMGLTDYALLQQRYGLNCAQYPVGAAQTDCQAAEAKLLSGKQAYNQYGIATALGGVQRLRAFDGGRYFAGQALSYGVEYRLNLTDEHTPFNILIAKGVRTGIQLAAFWEGGMVADQYRDLFKDCRSNYGVGLRMILSGVVLRFDLATGSEGTKTQLFLTYPWSMFSVDRPN